MTSDKAVVPATSRKLFGMAPALVSHWPAFSGLAVLVIPTIISLARQAWDKESGAHGPIVLVTALWLMSHTVRSDPNRAPLRIRHWLPLTLAGIPLYVFGRAYDFISLEATGMYLAAIVVAMFLVGLDTLRKNAFPFLYLAFVIPPPGWFMDWLTLPLKNAVSVMAVGILQMLGYPVMRQGVVVIVAQYQLLVEDACSGMNSLTGLIAVSLFYVYVLHRASWRYSLTLLLFAIPIAILANVIRISILVLLTYYFGDAVAQGFLHETAGMALFIMALVMTIFFDLVLQRFCPAQAKGLYPPAAVTR